MEKLQEKILVLGGDGMLGSKVVEELKSQRNYRFNYTLRKHNGDRNCIEFEVTTRNLMRDISNLFSSLSSSDVYYIINCIGVLKRASAENPLLAYVVNSAFPSALETYSPSNVKRIIHVSTDCVFSGKKLFGETYTELDIPDPVDIYGVSKAAGEITGEKSLTVRSSIIGLEKKRKEGLVEWFLNSEKENKVIYGFTNAIFTGMTASEFAKCLIRLCSDEFSSYHLLHIAMPTPISKFDLLSKLRDELNLDKKIIPIVDTTGKAANRALSSIYSEIKWNLPNWDEQIRSLAEEIKERKEKGEKRE